MAGNDLLLGKKNKETKERIVDRSICTVISGMPFRIREEKPGLFPVGMFNIPPVKQLGDVNVIVVKEGFYFRYVGDGKYIEQYEKAENIARSVVNDFVNSQLGIDISDEDVFKHAKPALFYVYGEEDGDSVIQNYGEIIGLALQQQLKWFERLVYLADDDWSKTHMHKSISDLQRYAADALGQKREWSAMAANVMSMESCPACKSNIPAGAIVCQVCRTIINPDAFKESGFSTIGA